MTIFAGLRQRLAVAQPEAAQAEEAPWWMNALSLAFSFLAITCSASVVELALNPTVFWMAQALTAALLVLGFYFAEAGSVFFWVAVIAISSVVTLMAGLLFAKLIAKRLVRR